MSFSPALERNADVDAEMSSRALLTRIAASARSIGQQTRGVKYTTKFALDRAAVKAHARDTAGTIPLPQY
jgi:hypothetical protein